MKIVDYFYPVTLKRGQDSSWQEMERWARNLKAVAVGLNEDVQRPEESIRAGDVEVLAGFTDKERAGLDALGEAWKKWKVREWRQTGQIHDSLTFESVEVIHLEEGVDLLIP